MDSEIAEIRDEHTRRFGDRKLWIIVDMPDGFEVHEWDGDGVAPPTKYPKARQAAARLLQLMGTGPVAPQTWPERVEITLVDSTDSASSGQEGK